MGRHMQAAILAIALMEAASLSPAHAENCGLVKLASYDIAPSNVIVVPVTVNEKEKEFLVDTGGLSSSISPGVVEELQLSQHYITSGAVAYMVDGTVMDHYVWADTLRLGSSIAKNISLIVQPQQSKAGIEAFDGTLAPDMLRNFDLDFDFGHNKLNLMSPKHCPAAVVYWADAFTEIPFVLDLYQHMIIGVTLNGVRTGAMVDTGASITTISEAAARQTFGLKDSDLPKLPDNEGDKLLNYTAHFDTLVLNGVTVRNPEIAILPDAIANNILKNNHSANDFATWELQAVPITIGMNVLRKLHLYVAYGEKKLYITGAAATHDAPAASAATVATPAAKAP